jgi:hypothetical protein
LSSGLTSRPEKRNISPFGGLLVSVRWRLSTAPMPVSLTSLLASIPVPLTRLGYAFRFQFLAVLLLADFAKKGDVFNILWALVFGFATLNILGLVARRFEPNRNRLNFGETIAIMVVIVSIVLLGWEMLTLFKIFPIKLQHHD